MVGIMILLILSVIINISGAVLLRLMWKNESRLVNECLSTEAKLTTVKKMWLAIEKYNENRAPNSEQMLIRRDMYDRVRHTLKIGFNYETEKNLHRNRS